MQVPYVIDRLRKAREQRDLAQEDVARALGYRGQTLSRWERGASSPSLVQLDAWARVLDLRITVEADPVPVLHDFSSPVVADVAPNYQRKNRP